MMVAKIERKALNVFWKYTYRMCYLIKALIILRLLLYCFSFATISENTTICVVKMGMIPEDKPTQVSEGKESWEM